MYYSKSTGGFYTKEIHGDNIPFDAVEITVEEHAVLLAAQSEGKIIQADANGYPEAVERVYTFEEKLQQKLATLAAYRFEEETGGITVNGSIIRTDRESQSLIAGAKLYSDLNETITIDWKGENGWVQIDRNAILAISQAVAAHVQACFSNEKVHADAINALTTVEEVEAYDITTGWPV